MPRLGVFSAAGTVLSIEVKVGVDLAAGELERAERGERRKLVASGAVCVQSSLPFRMGNSQTFAAVSMGEYESVEAKLATSFEFLGCGEAHCGIGLRQLGKGTPWKTSFVKNLIYIGQFSSGLQKKFSRCDARIPTKDVWKSECRTSTTFKPGLRRVNSYPY
ncbi:unnamed protein product [Bursaphelenchus xylophilus]|uniref:(pine wood nematode) hypothetical protein n=1 Tax=Bursaphelenchus xylophilus TaxID=6326 RepID=A0A1I7S6Z8_BURXY|nr:unnamed protein product [Bursaphelenchus xylophilus]CAG9079517.1 unnamed protein product [Bursaphelenchus xylophilus]